VDPKYRPDWLCTVPVAFIPHQRIEIESSRWNQWQDDMDHRLRLRLTLAPPMSSKKHCAVSTDASSTPIFQNIRCDVRAARRAKCCFIRWLPGRLTGSVSKRLQSRAFFFVSTHCGKSSAFNGNRKPGTVNYLCLFNGLGPSGETGSRTGLKM